MFGKEQSTINRKQAILENKKTYTSVSPCKICASLEKYVSSYGCVSCAVEKGLQKLNDPLVMAKYRTKEHKNKQISNWRKNNPEKVLAQKQRYTDKNGSWYKNNKKLYRNNHYNKTYGITLEEYDSLLISQKHSCKICGVSSELIMEQSGKSLSVDHNHITGKIRGLLCNSCNSGLGQFKDDIDIMNKAINYLRNSE
jgi:hypothetical protein